MLAASSYKLLKMFKAGDGFTSEQIQLLAVGNLVAFVVAMLAIKVFIGFLTRYGFKWFGWYRILAGGVILALYFAGVDLQIV